MIWQRATKTQPQLLINVAFLLKLVINIVFLYF